MRRPSLLCLAVFALLVIAARAVPTEDDLAKRYDYVGHVTNTSDSRFNRIGKTWMNLNETSTEVKKGIRLLVGIARDPNNTDAPYFGELYFAEWIGTGEIFMRFPAIYINGRTMDGMDDGDNMWRVVIIRKGQGYKRRDRE